MDDEEEGEGSVARAGSVLHRADCCLVSVSVFAVVVVS